MSNKTLGEVIRFMVSKAIESDDKSFMAPVREIYKLVNGCDYPELDAEDYADTAKVRESRDIVGMKSSYIYNTVTRIPELRDLDLKAKHSFVWLDIDGEETQPGRFDDDGADKYLKIYLVKGATIPKAKKRAEDEKKQAAVEAFKERIAKVMPDLSYLGDDEVLVAVSAIKAMKSIIQEMK